MTEFLEHLASNITERPPYHSHGPELDYLIYELGEICWSDTDSVDPTDGGKNFDDEDDVWDESLYDPDLLSHRHALMYGQR